MSRKFIPFALGGLEKKSIGYSRMVPFPLVNLHVTKEELKAFGDIYFDVVDGFAERDFDYFKNICEARLYQNIEKGMNDLDDSGEFLVTNEVKREDPNAEVEEPEIKISFMKSVIQNEPVCIDFPWIRDHGPQKCDEF